MSALTGNLGGGGGLKIVNGVLNAYPAFNDEKIEKGAFIEFANQQEGAVGIVDKKIQDPSSENAYTAFLTESLCVSIGGSSDGALYARAATITNGSAKWGTRLLLRDAEYVEYQARILAVSENSFIVASGSPRTGNDVIIYVCSVNGTTITLQAQKTNTNANNTTVNGLFRVSDGKYLVTGSRNDEGYISAFLFTVSGKTITFGNLVRETNYTFKMNSVVYYFPKHDTAGCLLYTGTYGDCEGYKMSINGITLSLANKTGIVSSGNIFDFTRMDNGNILGFITDEGSNPAKYPLRISVGTELTTKILNGKAPVSLSLIYENVIQNCGEYYCLISTPGSGNRQFLKFSVIGDDAIYESQPSELNRVDLSAYPIRKNKFYKNGVLIWVTGGIFANTVNSLKPDGLQKCVKKSVTKIEGFTQTEVTRTTKGKVWELKKEG